MTSSSGLRDWQGLRLALGLRQSDMAELLGIGVREVRRLERGTRNLGPGRVARLVQYLALKGPRERLKRAGVPHPFADEQARALAVWNRSAHRALAPAARPCKTCGEPLYRHPRCCECPRLLHGPEAAGGICLDCGQRRARILADAARRRRIRVVEIPARAHRDGPESTSPGDEISAKRAGAG